MRSARFIINFIFFLFAVYYLQGSIYPVGSIISQFSLLLILLVSAVYFIRTLFSKGTKSLFFIAWTLLILLNIVGFILTADFSETLHTSMFKEILGCMLPFYPFYYYAEKDEIKKSDLLRFFLIMLPVVILQFFLNRNQLISAAISGDEDVVTNDAYLFVSLIPFIFLIRNKIISGALMGMTIIFVILGAKRGAIVACSVGLLIYFYYQIKTLEKHNRVRGYLVAIIAMFVLSAFAYKEFISNEFLITRMTSISEGGMSNREIIYKEVFNNWYNSDNAWNLIFGFGFAGSVNLTGSYAHNDWLELMSNFGVVGICFYLFLFYSAVKCSLENDWMEDKRILMFTIVMMWFCISLISMWYTSLFFGAQAILLGYLIKGKSKSLE
jgi:hypothetical protein